MSFDTAVNTMDAALWSVMGDAAKHSDSRTRESTSVTVVVDEQFNTWGDAVQIAGANALLHVRRAELPRKPGRGDSFTLGDRRLYIVERVINQTRYEWQIEVVEDDSRV